MGDYDSVIPIYYSEKYNISFFGIEGWLHHFDAKKYGRVFHALAAKYSFTIDDCFQPTPLAPDTLRKIHTQQYLDSLNTSKAIAAIAEIPLLGMVPNYLLQRKLLNPMRLATSGTIQAAFTSLKYGWSINLSGGYHHAKNSGGEGFCFFADIPLAIHALLNDPAQPVQKILIVDLDAHQGNGFQCIFASAEDVLENREVLRYTNDPRIQILDMYNGEIYPSDHAAKQYITYDYPLPSHTKDRSYLSALRSSLEAAMRSNPPDIVFYNGGTDIYENDPLGCLSISAEGIIERDEIVFRACMKSATPIVMTLSGGYTQNSAGIIARSIYNLIDKKIVPLRPDPRTMSRAQSQS